MKDLKMTNQQIKLMRWAIELSVNVLEATPDETMPKEEAAGLIYNLNELDETIYTQVKEDE